MAPPLLYIGSVDGRFSFLFDGGKTLNLKGCHFLFSRHEGPFVEGMTGLLLLSQIPVFQFQSCFSFRKLSQNRI